MPPARCLPSPAFLTRPASGSGLRDQVGDAATIAGVLASTGSSTSPSVAATALGSLGAAGTAPGLFADVRFGSLPERSLRPGLVGAVTLVAAVLASTALSAPLAAAAPTPVPLSATASPPGRIFVANDGSAGSTGWVTEYTVRDSGDVRPVLTISSGVNQPYGLAFDASGDLWVANNTPNTVVEYKKSELAKTSPAPSVIISSSPDQALNGPSGLAFDSSGNLWVTNVGGAGTVIQYTKADLSGSGSPAPRVTITDAALFANGGPAGLAVDPSGDLWVEGSLYANADAVREYPKAQLAKPGPPAPRATISPGFQLWDFTFDSSGDLWAPEYYDSAVAEYTKAELTKTGSPPAHLTITGSIFVLNEPQDLAFDSSGDLWVLGTGDNALVEYTKAELANSGSPAPASIIKGPATGLNTPQYFAIEP